LKFNIFHIALVTTLLFHSVDAQQQGIYKGLVYNQKDNNPLETANIINKTEFKGAITNRSGYFEIEARVGDTLIVSYLGFKNYQVIVHPGDFEKIHEIYMVEQPISLQEVIITGYRLTGILKTDLRLLPLKKEQKIDLDLDFYYGDTTSNRLTRINKSLRKIMDPVGLLYNLFSAHGKDLRKLKKMQQDEELVRMLNARFDRKIISDLLDIPEAQVYRMLELCDYDKKFLTEASDFQILEALRVCYEKHKVLFNRKNE
jgi:hypothetical protein